MTTLITAFATMGLGKNHLFDTSPPSHWQIANVPFAEALPDLCGPATLAAVLQFHGEKTNARAIAKDIFLPNYKGSLNLDLLLWARQKGFTARAGNFSNIDLRQALSKNLPVICMVRSRGALVDRNHFVIVRGYDDAARIWYVDTGAGKEVHWRASDFERAWEECGHWALVVAARARCQPEE